jgi:D-aspartate ligase
MKGTLNVLLLGQTLHVARCLGRGPGIRLHVLGDNRLAPARFSRYVRSFRVYEAWDDERAVERVRCAVEESRAEVVLPAHTPHVRFVSEHRDALSRFVTVAPTPAPKVIDVVSDKWLLAEFLARHGLGQPPTVLATDDAAFELTLRGLAFPALLKPRLDLADGRGIRRFESAEQLRAFLEKNPEHWGGYVVQSFVRGHDVCCNVLCREGEILAYTVQRARIPSRRPYSPAAIIEFVEDGQALDLVAGLVATLGYSGVAHIDMRRDEESGRVGVLEVNARYWGSLLGSLSAGVNFPHLHCLAALGVPFPQPSYSKKRYLVKEPLEHLRARWRRGGEGGITLGDTPLRYDVADPLPRAAKLTLTLTSSSPAE